jgi:F0F1-type ATP synthase membrane subunit c/vacuolar-type H+-ATPase subunit K
MDRNLALLLLFTFCILGPCFVFAACAKASIGALGRNPSAAPKIFITMLIILVFAQGAAVIALLLAFQMFG